MLLNLTGKRLLSVGIISLMVCPASYAQTDPPPAVPVKASESVIPAGERYLMDFYKVSQAEAKQRIDLQESIGALAERLGNQNPDAFGGV